jgi:hypothetical protein
MHKPHFQLKHLSEILGDKISSDQTPDEINSLGRVLGIPVSADVPGDARCLLDDHDPPRSANLQMVALSFSVRFSLSCKLRNLITLFKWVDTET